MLGICGLHVVGSKDLSMLDNVGCEDLEYVRRKSINVGECFT